MPLSWCSRATDIIPRAGIAWLGADDTPAALTDLAGSVQRVAAEAGIALPSQRFRPHVTLARKAQPPPDAPLDNPIRWPVCSLSLTESTQEHGDAVYRDLARWPLKLV